MVLELDKCAMSKDAAQFVFMTCRAGAEAALKQEIARVEPDWRPAFSRPGFMTFKNAGERAIDARLLAERHWVLAHAPGVSLGHVKGSQLAQLVEQIWQHPGVAALVAAGELADVHVWQRVPMPLDDRGMESCVTPLTEEIEAAIRAAAPAECTKLSKSMPKLRKPTLRDSLVLDVVLVEPDEWWFGCHAAATQAARWPGGQLPVELPEHAVSRAYAKLEEALAWSGLPLAKDDECVEIGCAPGGASQALLKRGLFVTGIDPADVDPCLLEHPRFRHLKKRGSEVRRKEFLGVRWLVTDVNLAPEATLNEVESVIRHPDVSIRGMVLTLKLSEWSWVERLPEFVERVRGWGYRDVRVRQLVSGGQEVCLVALRSKALRRLGRGTRKKPSRKRDARPQAAAAERLDGPHNPIPEPHF